MVENETPGTGVYPYLTKPDHFIPATTPPPAPTADDESRQTEERPAAADDSYLDELNYT
nr:MULTISPECIES: hypothetical protein [unclassified Rhodococcus (in: high G+C Gram-positive bacteria)]